MQENLGSIPGLGSSPGEVNGNPLHLFLPGNSMDKGAWWPTVHGVTQSQTQLSTHTNHSPDNPHTLSKYGQASGSSH